MPRLSRIAYGANYRVMARSKGHRHVVREDRDRNRLVDDLRRSVTQLGLGSLASAIMGSHVHAILKTRSQPRPGHAAIPFGVCDPVRALTGGGTPPRGDTGPR
jgi:hypothetical protein